MCADGGQPKSARPREGGLGDQREGNKVSGHSSSCGKERGHRELNSANGERIWANRQRDASLVSGVAGYARFRR